MKQGIALVKQYAEEIAKKPGRDQRMCELFGICSKEPLAINEYLKEFFEHSVRHPHGWGLACMEGKEALIEKEPVQASKSNYLKERLSMPVCEKNVFAHIRYATIGNVEFRNCHPYSVKDESGRRWTQIHNGTIFDFEPLARFSAMQSGDTDSERILLYLISEINREEKKKGGRLSGSERFLLLDSLIVQMAKGNKLNLLLFDGEYMYVHTNYAESLYCLEKQESTLFSTTPLTKEEWKPVVMNTLLGYRNGKLMFQGTRHGHTYVDSEENLKYLYQIFSNL